MRPCRKERMSIAPITPRMRSQLWRYWTLSMRHFRICSACAAKGLFLKVSIRRYGFLIACNQDSSVSQTFRRLPLVPRRSSFPRSAFCHQLCSLFSLTDVPNLQNADLVNKYIAARYLLEHDNPLLNLTWRLNPVFSWRNYDAEVPDDQATILTDADSLRSDPRAARSIFSDTETVDTSLTSISRSSYGEGIALHGIPLSDGSARWANNLEKEAPVSCSCNGRHYCNNCTAVNRSDPATDMRGLGGLDWYLHDPKLPRLSRFPYQYVKEDTLLSRIHLDEPSSAIAEDASLAGPTRQAQYDEYTLRYPSQEEDPREDSESREYQPHKKYISSTETVGVPSDRIEQGYYVRGRGWSILQPDGDDITEVEPASRDRTPTRTSQMEETDPRYRVRKASRFKPGQTLWSEPSDATTESYKHDGGGQFYLGFRRLVIVANDEDHCTCVPILTYMKQGCAKQGVIAAKHGIIYEAGTKARPLKGEPKLGFPPVRMNITAAGERLAKESRVNYSKLITVEHNVKVFFIGSIDQADFINIVAKAVDKCWGDKVHMTKTSSGTVSKQDSDNKAVDQITKT
ncbi:hypothetical protein GE09DRAFT_432277 [Coniochaeta sp. 2T2.1]|nr:hypothetical protein GE09DRAFT_432277 [Coniochaeta sp. 2T2.1]